MIAQSNVTHMYVTSTTGAVATSGKTRDDMVVGDIWIFKAGSTTAATSALSAGDKFVIVHKDKNSNLVTSPVITYDNITAKTTVAYAAPAQRVRYIGFNGTSGTIDVVNNNEYVAHIFLSDTSKAFSQNNIVKFAAYLSDASATQAEIASGFATSFNKNFSRETYKTVKAEILLNNAGTALGTAVDTITLKNGSKYFTADDIDDATTNDAMAVGDYLRIGTATTSPCYKITAIDTTNNIGTLEMPYQGVDYSAEDTAFELVTASDAASAAAGIALTALAMTGDFEPGVIRYDILDFTLEVQDGFGSTSTSDGTTPSFGSGSYWEVAQNEWFLKGNRGKQWRVGSYPKTVSLDAVSGINYNQLTLTYFDSNARTIGRNVNSYGNILIANSTTGTDYITQLSTVLSIS